MTCGVSWTVACSRRVLSSDCTMCMACVLYRMLLRLTYPRTVALAYTPALFKTTPATHGQLSNPDPSPDMEPFPFPSFHLLFPRLLQAKVPIDRNNCPTHPFFSLPCKPFRRFLTLSSHPVVVSSSLTLRPCLRRARIHDRSPFFSGSFHPTDSVYTTLWHPKSFLCVFRVDISMLVQRVLICFQPYVAPSICSVTCRSRTHLLRSELRTRGKIG